MDRAGEKRKEQEEENQQDKKVHIAAFKLLVSTVYIVDYSILLFFVCFCRIISRHFYRQSFSYYSRYLVACGKRRNKLICFPPSLSSDLNARRRPTIFLRNCGCCCKRVQEVPRETRVVFVCGHGWEGISLLSLLPTTVA